MNESVEIENVDHEVRLRDCDRAETSRARKDAMRDAFIDRASARARGERNRKTREGRNSRNEISKKPKSKLENIDGPDERTLTHGDAFDALSTRRTNNNTPKLGRFVSIGRVGVPKPVQLPSERFEHGGQDPNARLVPKNGTGNWKDDRDENHRRDYHHDRYRDDRGSYDGNRERGYGYDGERGRRSHDFGGREYGDNWRSSDRGERMSGSGRDLGRSWRDRDHGFGRPERASPDREKSWRRKEEPDLPPVTAPAAQAPRRSFEVHHIAEGALEKLHITQGDGEWLEEGDDMSRLAPPAWLMQDAKNDRSIPEPRKDNGAASSPRVKVIARPKEHKTPFSSAKLPEHLRNSKREPGEEKKLWTPPEPIGSAAKKSVEKAHISPAKTSSKTQAISLPEPRSRKSLDVLPCPKTTPQPRKSSSAKSRPSPPPPNVPPPPLPTSPMPPPVPPGVPIGVPIRSPPMPPGAPPYTMQPPLPPTPPPPLPPGVPPGVQPPLPAGQPPAAQKVHSTNGAHDKTKIAKMDESARVKALAKKKKANKVPSGSGDSSSEKDAAKTKAKAKAKTKVKAKAKAKAITDSSQNESSDNTTPIHTPAKSKRKTKTPTSAKKSNKSAADSPAAKDTSPNRSDASRAETKITI